MDLKKKNSLALLILNAPPANALNIQLVEELGIDYVTISQFNPRIIYCSVSGFGQKGPYRNRPALDPIIQAMGGIMSIIGDPRTGPVKVGSPIADLVASLLSTIGIFGALYERERTGMGQKVEISMLDGIIFSLIPRQAYYFITGNLLPLTGNQHYQVAPCNTFLTKDGKYVIVIAHTEKPWLNFCEGLGRKELTSDPRFKLNSERLRHAEELNKILAEVFQEKTQQEWVEVLANKGIMIAPVNTFEQIFQDPQILEDEMVQELEHPLVGKIRVLRLPINFSKSPVKIKMPPPLLGQHTDEILSEFGCTKEEINQYKESGVVKGI